MTMQTCQPPTATLSTDALRDEAHIAMGMSNVESALEGVARVRQSVQAHAISARSTAQTIVAELLAGQPATVDIADRLGDAVTANDREEAVLGWLDHVRTSLTEAVTMLRATALDDGLAVLRPHLAAVLDQARPAIAALGSAMTADEAVTNHVVDAWREATRLAADHDTIRLTQRRLIVDSSTRAERTTGLADVYGHVQHPERHADVARYMEMLIDHARRANPLTGAAIEPAALPWLSGSAVDRLRFACRDDVRPWLPTWQEMLAAQEESRANRTTSAERSNSDGTSANAGDGRREHRDLATHQKVSLSRRPAPSAT